MTKSRLVDSKVLILFDAATKVNRIIGVEIVGGARKDRVSCQRRDV